MKLYEFSFSENMRKLSDDQRKFVGKMIVRETKRVAKEHNMDEESAYWALMHGLFGGDREVNFGVES